MKTKIKSVMIVTKARDHSLVQLTHDLALWLMTTPRYGNRHGVTVYVDGKLEKSTRFDADGLLKEHPVVQEKKLLRYWTPETCVYADTYDIVITVRAPDFHANNAAWRRRHCIVYVVALPADCSSRYLIQPRISGLSYQF